MTPTHAGPAAPDGLPAAQQPDWPDPGRVRAVRAELGALPGLVPAHECDRLGERLAAVARGEAFLLQGGDCAEEFRRATPGAVHGTAQTLLRMAGALEQAAGLPVVTVGRLAGQYAKPRSRPTETRGGRTLPAYRGDAVNGAAFTAADRAPDPRRLLAAYDAARTTLGLMSAYLASARGAASREVFASHEGLLLDYELPLRRTDPATGRAYATSGHLIWAGERTRGLDDAHIAFLAGIANPVAVKIGPTARPGELKELVRRLDPEHRPGRLTFVIRVGARKVRQVLPDLVAAVAETGAPVAWVCDPMHGNTFEAPTGHKTRHFDDVYDEIAGFFEVHAMLGTHPGGVHLELTGDEVTECVGGGAGSARGAGVSFADLPWRYASACDPRLNRSQSLEMGRLIAGLVAERTRVPVG
ncbi:putative phospho-2-dehydro-3-deoxyheptonate aldolase [Actinacidiphila reveromycinica]|uniref:Phospho-2-dehydro-3-deoxyheptonate aldolase n=1 Tax=Actinacidiphila reveromycinica TaxID=659352 RepID=A0A7U3UWZ3_9ACTN|nr:3-deoxy-7-phosphoheptulonate synthase class II [Streptomyces sp. SN-593]BBB00129.1 putative phospho-2-dehydro-3-deoxyheptonate aldolase [Streptomyces sp. SN-593]